MTSGGMNSNNPEKNDNDINAGILLRSKLNDEMSFEIGSGLYHISSPDLSLIEGGNSNDTEVEARLAIHGKFNAQLNEKWSISPGFLYQTMGASDEMAVQAWGGYNIDPEKEITLRFGTGYRLRDALELMIGIDYGPLRAGIAYDLTTSDLKTANNGNGAIEFGVSYIAKIFKTPNPDREIICPRL